MPNTQTENASSASTSTLPTLLENRIFPFTAPETCPISYQIGDTGYHGIPASFHPTVKRTQPDANLTLYSICGQHSSGLVIRAECFLYRDFPVTDWIAYFENTADTPSPVISEFRIQGELAAQDGILEHTNGDDCTENGYTVTKTPLSESTLSLFPKDGTPCCGAGPYMRLLFDQWGINLAIGFPAMWQADFSYQGDSLVFSVGQKRCHMSLLPGECIRSPRIVFQAFSGDSVRGCNDWRRFYFAHILPRADRNPISPKLCLHLFGDGGPEFTNTTAAHQTTALKTYLDRGIVPDIWWMDAGWYPCDSDWPHTGTWECDKKRFPNGLGEIGRLCEENGVQFLLWFEPERVRKNTWLSDHHPEWLLENGTENALLYYGNPDALNWLIQYVNQCIKEYHIGVYRQDFNFAPLSYWEKYESENRIGAMENLHMQGYLSYYDALLDANPGLIIDSCASGGRRNDLDTMRRAIPLHYTDVGYGNHPIKQKQHRLMFTWIPYFRAHNMSWDDDFGTYGTGASKPIDRFAYHCALAPALTDMISYDASDQQYETALLMHSIWRRAAEIELRADYYPLTDCRADPRDWYAMQFDDVHAGDGFVQLIRNTQAQNETFDLHMVVHDPEAVYFFENMENGEMMQLTGEQLLDGIPISLSEREGVVWFYHIVTF